MRSLVFLAALAAGHAARAVSGDRTITQVVDLLEGMMEKSKADGATDRDLWAHFKCYCDQTTESKDTAVSDYTNTIEALEAEIADRSAQSEALSTEIAGLQTSMDANAKGRLTAAALRASEKAHYEAEAADMSTGSAQLNRALDMLKAVDPLGEHSFLQTHAQRWVGAADALKAAAAWVPNPEKQQRVLAAAKAVKAQRAPAGGIAGVLKTFSDTFGQNLAAATAAEEVAAHDAGVLAAAQLEDWNTQDGVKSAKEVSYGTHQSEIARATSEKDAAVAAKAADEAFLLALAARCKEKGEEFQHRNKLRAAEDAAVAQAIAILNADSAFSTFGKVSATSTGATAAFVQLAPYAAVARKLRVVAQKSHSLRLATLASKLAAGENVFDKVLASLRKTIARIDTEEAADVTKKDWCAAEQLSATEGKTAKETNIGTLEGTLSTLSTGMDDSQSSQDDANDSLATNRASQKSETEARAAEHAAYLENVKNLQEAERILAKATEVLENYYAYLEAHNAPHHYDKKTGKGSMGGDMKRMPSASEEELEEACSADPACLGFTSEGWLKSTLEEEGEWFDTGADMFVKVFDRTAAHAALVQRDEPIDVGTPESWGDGVESEGQRDQGAEVLKMLRFILSETTTERETATSDENTAQGNFETTMTGLQDGANTLQDTLGTLAMTLAAQRKDHQEAKQDKAATTKDLEMIVQYLADIKPGCDFIQENYDARKQARADEKTALEGAITQLEATPAFTAAE